MVSSHIRCVAPPKKYWPFHPNTIPATPKAINNPALTVFFFFPSLQLMLIPSLLESLPFALKHCPSTSVGAVRFRHDPKASTPLSPVTLQYLHEQLLASYPLVCVWLWILDDWLEAVVFGLQHEERRISTFGT
jgi:hypothetical protein